MPAQTLFAPDIPRTASRTVMGLAVLMAATRFHPMGSALNLPDASLAVFFLAGWFIRSPLVLAGFLAAAFSIDYVAITYAGTSGFCVSPAYGFLLPAYAVMWLAGRWAVSSPAPDRASWKRWMPALFASTTTAYLITEVSFFLFSGRENGVDWATYGSGMIEHYPSYLAGTAAYAVLAYFLAGRIEVVFGVHGSRAILK